jgi:hypothetical protein
MRKSYGIQSPDRMLWAVAGAALVLSMLSMLFMLSMQHGQGQPWTWLARGWRIAGSGRPWVSHNGRLEREMSALIREAKARAEAQGIYTEVGSRRRLEALRQGGRRDGETGSAAGRENGDNGKIRTGEGGESSWCRGHDDCGRGVCDREAGRCRCAMGYAGVQCRRVAHVEWSGRGMLPLDVLEATDEAVEVSERCVVRAVPGRGSGTGDEAAIAGRLVESYGMSNEDPRLGTLAALLDAMRRCIVVEVVQEAGREGGQGGQGGQGNEGHGTVDMERRLAAVSYVIQLLES